MDMNGNIVAIYGGIINKLKKMKNLEKSKIKILHRIAKEAQEALRGGRDEGGGVGRSDPAASIPMRHILSIIPSAILQGDRSVGARSKRTTTPTATTMLINEIAAQKKAELDWQMSKESEKQLWKQIDKLVSRDDDCYTPTSGVDHAMAASIDMISTLEPIVEKFFLNGQVTFDEINQIGVEIDQEMIEDMVAAGASEEDIRCYKSAITSRPPSTSTCVYHNMYKLFQLSYNKPVDDTNQELRELREYHKEVLTKTARIMEPFSPYRIKLRD